MLDCAKSTPILIYLVGYWPYTVSYHPYWDPQGASSLPVPFAVSFQLIIDMTLSAFSFIQASTNIQTEPMRTSIKMILAAEGFQAFYEFIASGSS